ncbi:MAG: ABC transporter, partial [archaeon]|nr:ABC transporter [archaeon]
LLNPDLIIADEASNHMDMQSIEALEKGLHAFQGAIVIISHDLRLLNAIAAERYVLRRKLLVAYPGSVEDYQQESSAMQSRRLRRLMQSKV